MLDSNLATVYQAYRPNIALAIWAKVVGEYVTSFSRVAFTLKAKIVNTNLLDF